MADLDNFNPVDVQLSPDASLLIARHLAKTNQAGLRVTAKSLTEAAVDWFRKSLTPEMEHEIQGWTPSQIVSFAVNRYFRFVIKGGRING